MAMTYHGERWEIGDTLVFIGETPAAMGLKGKSAVLIRHALSSPAPRELCECGDPLIERPTGYVAVRSREWAERPETCGCGILFSLPCELTKLTPPAINTNAATPVDIGETRS